MLLYFSLLCLFGCTIDNKDVTAREWKYGSGFWMGDMLTFGSEGFKLQHDTIYLSNTSKALIVKTSKRYLIFTSEIEIKSLLSGQVGTYYDVGLRKE